MARSLSPPQASELFRAHLDTLPVSRSAPLAAIADRISAILGCKVVIAVRADEPVWSVAAESEGEVSAPPVDVASRFNDYVYEAGDVPRCLTIHHVEWTIALGGRGARVAVLVHGDWTTAASVLRVVADNVALVWRAHGVARRERQRIAAHGLARRLGAARGSAVSDVITYRMARAVGARFAALALPDVSGRRLFFVATYGYPLELVEHLRIEPGAGIVGLVFQSGQMVHSRGVESMPEGWRRRPRYRTESFIAMPLRAGQETYGVICVADRLDDDSFSDEDVRALRPLAEIAALALARERALAQAESYAHAAAVDPLTGTFNRRYFQTRLEEELERSRRHTLSLTLLLVDIDNFKTINDTHGHLAGDAVLKDIAEILRRSVRMFDVCARFGGEEFAIIMPGSNAESVATVAERIRERIEAYRSAEPALLDVRVTVSIGIGVSSAQMSPRDLINRADQALYLAKRDGKNVVRAVGIDAD